MWNIHDFLELFIESSKLVEISDNFGKYQLGLPTDISAQKFHRQHCATQQLPNGFDLGGHHPKHLGNCAVDPGRADQIEGLVVYLERFAHFFRAEFFCKRAFEIMNSETKAEHAGFRVTTEALYTHYTAERLARGDPFAEEMADTLVEECYDEWFTELDIPKVQDFFSWLGVVERPAAGALEQVAASEEETIAEIIARSCRRVAANSKMSSAKRKLVTVVVLVKPVCISHLFSFHTPCTSRTMFSSKALNKHELSGSPCLTPLSEEKRSTFLACQNSRLLFAV